MIANGFDRKYSTCDKKFNHKKQWNLNSIWKKCTDFVSNIECPGSAAYVFFFQNQKNVIKLSNLSIGCSIKIPISINHHVFC